MEVGARLETAPTFEDRLHLLAGGARVRGRLENDEVSGAEPGRDLLGGRDEDAQVGLALARERRRESHEDRVDVAEPVVVRGRGDEAGLDERRQHLASERPRCSSRQR